MIAAGEARRLEQGGIAGDALIHLNRLLRSTLASEPPSSAPPVAELGRVLQELLRRESEIDRREVEGGENQDAKAELWRQTNLEAIDGIELAIASLAATELAEAALQILIAAGYANQVADELEESRLREPVMRGCARRHGGD
jgi:hypothetical protein